MSQLENQEEKTKMRLITYYSRKILVIKQNYNIYNKELLVIVLEL